MFSLMSFTAPPIVPIDKKELETTIRARLDNLTKPPKSLGRLEDLVVQYCLCRGSSEADLQRKALFVFAGDHGITAQGVTPYPSEVTAQMVANMIGGGAAVTVMCRTAGVEYSIVDIGVKADVPASNRLVSKKVLRGTNDFSAGPAMTIEECERALNIGIDLAKQSPADLFAVGEMGIGNTSSASALIALFLGFSGAETVGAGTGAQGELLDHKRHVIDNAVKMHREQTDGSPLDILRRAGGLEIAGMAGCILGAAHTRRPVVIDGFIATAAALAASRLAPACADYLFFGHVSSEHFHRAVLDEMEASPLLNFDMRLGEGTGAVLAMQVIEQGLRCYHEMATFDSAGVSNKQ